MCSRKLFFLGILAAFIAGYSFKECSIFLVKLSYNFFSTTAEAFPGSPYHKLTAMSLISNDCRRDIAGGNYKAPYEYLRNRRAAWALDNTPEFWFRRFSKFDDKARREFLDVYIEQLREKGYNDWIKKIQTRERDDYYNAILARLRYLYVVLRIVYAQGKDDVFFARLWNEFDAFNQQLNKALNIVEVESYKEILGLSFKDRRRIQTGELILPEPEYLPADGEKIEWE